jgi:hypothetical protein
VSIDIQVLREVLRVQPGEDDEYEGDLAVEKMGDEAFDWLVRELHDGKLTAAESVRALRLLSRLTRQFCLGRKGDLLDLVMSLAQSEAPNPEVRSTAAHIAAGNVLIARSLAEPLKAYGRSPEQLEAQVSRAVQRALEIGVTPEMAVFVREYLIANGHR